VSVPRTVAEALRQHVTLEVEGIDRLYLNVYVADLQRDQGVVWFLRHHRGHPFASSALMDPISKAFVAAIGAFVEQNQVPLLSFAKRQRKDDVAAQYRAAFPVKEGVLFVGVLTEGVTPSLHIDYKGCRIKQYHKEGRALRTEATFHNTLDFKIGKRLHNLPALRAVGFRANRRLLDVQQVSHDCAIGEEVFREVTQPVTVQGQRASALRYADPCVLALFSALLVFRLLPRGFANHELREHLAPLLGEYPSALTQGRMTYQLRRLRLHGLIVRRPGSHRYEVTSRGLRIALFFTRSYARVVRPGLAELSEAATAADGQLRRAADQFEAAMDRHVARAKLTGET
jgi:hypothetical protein